MATINSCEDDRAPLCVSQMLQAMLQYFGLSPLEQSLKRDCAVSTYRGFAYLCDGLFYRFCEGQMVGTVSRLVQLRMQASRDVAVVEELLLQKKDCTDAEPELISRKLAAKLKHRGLECLSGVLVSCDIVRFEWLGMLSRHDIQIVCECVYAQGLDYDGERVGRLCALCGEAAIEWMRRLRGGGGYGVSSYLFQTVALARGTEHPLLVVAQGIDEGLQTFTGRTQELQTFTGRTHVRGDGGDGTGPPPLGAAHGGDAINGADDQAPQTFHWQRFLLSSLAKLELERALIWSTHPKLKWADASATLKRADRDLCCQARDLVDAPRQRRDLRGALRAFRIICELAKAAKRDGWSNSGCASAIRSAAPTLRDVAAWRACDLVGIGDREAYLTALNNCSNGEIERNPNFQSQMLMAFESSMGALPGAFPSNSSKDARRRGKARPRRQRGGGAAAQVDAAGIEGLVEDVLAGEDEEYDYGVDDELPADDEQEANGALMCPCFECNGQDPDGWGVECWHRRSSCSTTPCGQEAPTTTVTAGWKDALRELLEALRCGGSGVGACAASSSSSSTGPYDGGVPLDQVRTEQLRAAVQAALSSNSWARIAADHAEGNALLHGTTAVLLALLDRNNNDNSQANARLAPPNHFPSEHGEEESDVATATRSFAPTAPNMVPVQAGDRIQILERHPRGCSVWTYVKNLSLTSSSPTNAGWVPSWIVQPVAAPAPEPAQQSPKPKGQVVQPPKPTGTELGTADAWLAAPRVQPMAELVLLRGHTIATSSFSAASASELSLLVGDSVEIIEQHEAGWNYGRKVESGSEGWFPAWAVQ